MGIKEFTESYKTRLKALVDGIDPQVMEEIVNALERTIEKKSRIFIIGNGGSAATASHMANDFAAGLSRRGIRNFNVQSLADNFSLCTALANDIGFENIFSAQLKPVLKKDDLLIAISCSGNSPNIIKAVELARETGAAVVGCTGFDGGQLKELSSIVFHVPAPKGEYGLVEDLHMILDHLLYSYYVGQGE